MHHGVADFARLIDYLRSSGLECPTARVQLFAGAIAALEATTITTVGRAGKATLCSTLEEQLLLDQALRGLHHLPKSPGATEQVSEAVVSTDPSADVTSDQRWDVPAVAAPETIEDKAFPEFERHDLSSLRKMLEDVARHPRTIKTFRQTKGQRGSADLAAVALKIVRLDGDLHRIPTKGRSREPWDIDIAVDVSGSMRGYTQGHLIFAFLLQQLYPGKVTAYSVGTHCSRLEGNFRTHPWAEAMSKSLNDVHGYSGGTDLGASFASLYRQVKGRRSRGRGLVIFSDGWDAGGTNELETAMRDLRTRYERIVWSNPHVATPGFRPVQKGMGSVQRNIDFLVSGHSVRALREVLALFQARLPDDQSSGS